jgi:hypothetical protein
MPTGLAEIAALTLIGSAFPPQAGRWETALRAMMALGAAALAITETLSAFDAIRPSLLLAAWAFLLLLPLRLRRFAVEQQPFARFTAVEIAMAAPYQYSDLNAFVLPPLTAPRHTTSGRNILRGPGLINWDFGVFKNFQITESKLLEFQYEAFNIFNHANFLAPASNAEVPTTFGRITGRISLASNSSGGPELLPLAFLNSC